jgi:hypothetical protein
MVTASSPQSNTGNNGAVTEKTVYWTETIVRWTRGESALIRVEPTENGSQALLDVHRGDMIHVRTDIKRGEWVPCRAGHVTGWLNTAEVKLIRTGSTPTEEVVYVQSPPMSQNSVHDDSKKHRTTLIQRLIKFFK